jgi:cysteine synthase
MSIHTDYPEAEMQRVQQWLSGISADLYQSRESSADEIVKVRLHMAAQDAHRLASEMTLFTAAYRALKTDKLIG